LANNTELNTGPFVWGAAENAAGQPDDSIARTGPDISRETFMDDTFRAFMLLYRSGVWHKGMNADLLDGRHASYFQAACATLTALCALDSFGFVTKTAADTIAARTITVGTGLDIVDGDGVAGDPAIALDVAELSVVTIASDDHVVISDTTDSSTKRALVSDIVSLAAAGAGDISSPTNLIAGRVPVATGVKAIDDSDFKMTTDGTNVLSVGSGIAIDFDSKNFVDVGTVNSGAHTVDLSSTNAIAQSIGENSTTGPWEDKYPVEFLVSSSSATFDIPTASDSTYIVTLDLAFQRDTAGSPRGGAIYEKACWHNAGGTPAARGSIIGPTTVDPSGLGVTAVLSASGTNIRLTVTDSSGATIRVRGFVTVSLCGGGA
jgi:hypothetical protein